MSAKIVVKIGTAVANAPEGGVNRVRLAALARELAGVQKKGFQPVLVSSGAIGAGMDIFGWRTRPTVLRDKQAAAAVGQVALMHAYAEIFASMRLTVAQILLTRSDLEDRERYLNARNTFSALLERGVIPIVNENDTVATDEIQFGDNDSLAAVVAVKMGARKLFLLTDVDGLLDLTKGGAPLPQVFQITPEIEALIRHENGTRKSVGGMASKIQAAKMAGAAGVEVWIASGQKPGVVESILEGGGVGTRFEPLRETLDARRRWIAFGRRVKGSLTLDAGAVTALVDDKRSLLAAGILKVQGRFSAGDTVKVVSLQGEELARGSVSYSSSEIQKIKGKRTIDLEKILRRPGPSEVIHRNNLVMMTAGLKGTP